MCHVTIRIRDATPDDSLAVGAVEIRSGGPGRAGMMHIVGSTPRTSGALTDRPEPERAFLRMMDDKFLDGLVRRFENLFPDHTAPSRTSSSRRSSSLPRRLAPRRATSGPF
jgi:hypothetical protein